MSKFNVDTTIFYRKIGLAGVACAILFLSAATVSAASAITPITASLSVGSHGSAVANLQSFLALSPDFYPKNEITGYYGPLTKKAVSNFQEVNGINPVGLVDPETLAKMNNIITVIQNGAAVQTVNTTNINPSSNPSQALPLQLEIPSINVNAAIDDVGLTPAGAMGMISGIKDVAWFDQGALPGQIGTAVIGGHYGDGAPGVFRNLNQLNVGDSVYVKDNQGITRQFIVKAINIYHETDSVPQVFTSDDGIAHLNIITCHGTWIPSLQTYSERLVVFTDMVS